MWNNTKQMFMKLSKHAVVSGSKLNNLNKHKADVYGIINLATDFTPGYQGYGQYRLK